MAVVFTEPAARERETFVVGMGELAVTASPVAVLSCIGLGSCVAVCVYDRLAKVGGMAHIVLPQHNGSPVINYAKYADTAVPLLLEEVIKNGGARKRLIVKIAGGAQMTLAPGLRDTFKTGEKNLAQIKLVLQRENITLTAADTGGNLGRTVKMFIDTGKITVKTASGIAQEL